MGNRTFVYFDNTGNLDCVKCSRRQRLFAHLGHMLHVSQHPLIVGGSVNKQMCQ